MRRPSLGQLFFLTEKKPDRCLFFRSAGLRRISAQKKNSRWKVLPNIPVYSSRPQNWTSFISIQSSNHTILIIQIRIIYQSNAWLCWIFSSLYVVTGNCKYDEFTIHTEEFTIYTEDRVCFLPWCQRWESGSIFGPSIPVFSRIGPQSVPKKMAGVDYALLS